MALVFNSPAEYEAWTKGEEYIAPENKVKEVVEVKELDEVGADEVAEMLALEAKNKEVSDTLAKEEAEFQAKQAELEAKQKAEYEKAEEVLKADLTPAEKSKITKAKNKALKEAEGEV